MANAYIKLLDKVCLWKLKLQVQKVSEETLQDQFLKEQDVYGIVNLAHREYYITIHYASTSIKEA